MQEDSTHFYVITLNYNIFFFFHNKIGYVITLFHAFGGSLSKHTYANKKLDNLLNASEWFVKSRVITNWEAGDDPILAHQSQQ